MNALLELERRKDECRLAARGREQRIQQRVRAELSIHQPSALRSVTCRYQRGMLQLRGEVDCDYLKQLAQEYARRVDGVTHVVNSIHVIDPSETVSTTSF
ncbi:BON domain protein [Rubripirellula lacrimiformis]|uniref:BON domain protein n=1 Tax=Rubripirellula lacrimiformis TaxID=1930273 RepID=A0A517N4S2_9BACT|nr:BON domain-containing protein [Rubripirellula lacrimiformis]QDT02129.1 BON domain protein [Rubripirellula lacrimiformis]